MPLARIAPVNHNSSLCHGDGNWGVHLSKNISGKRKAGHPVKSSAASWRALANDSDGEDLDNESDIVETPGGDSGNNDGELGENIIRPEKDEGDDDEQPSICTVS